MAADTDLMTAINAMVHEKTLSLEALRGLTEIKDRAERLSKAVETKDKQIEEHHKLNVAHDGQISNLNAELAGWKKRETLLKEREVLAEKAIALAEKHQAVAEAYEKSMRIVFAPNMVRETVTKSLPVAVAGGGNTCGFTTTGNENSSTTREEGR